VDRDVVDVGKVNPPAGHYREVIVKKRDAVGGDADKPVCIENAKAKGDLGGPLYTKSRRNEHAYSLENKCKCNADERHPGDNEHRGTGKETGDNHKVGDAFEHNSGHQREGSHGSSRIYPVSSYDRNREKADGILGLSRFRDRRVLVFPVSCMTESQHGGKEEPGFGFGSQINCRRVYDSERVPSRPLVKTAANQRREKKKMGMGNGRGTPCT
jgi:hypothetical protein